MKVLGKSAVILWIGMLALPGCASYEVVQIPRRDADLYPLAQNKEGITVAVDQITDAARAKQYFGADLFPEGIVPINVVFSNHSGRRLLVKPSDILMQRSTSIVDPIPAAAAAEIAKRNYRRLKSRTEQQIDEYFEELTLRETVLVPEQTYQGVLFFQATRPDERHDRFFTVMNLFRQGALRVQIGVTDLETHQRLHFGPFPILVR